MQTRQLTSEEIRILERQGCHAVNWGEVGVREGFCPERLKRVHFSGRCTVGSLEGGFALAGGLMMPCGISDATLHNVEVGDGCWIANIRGYIANYTIGKGSRITNIDNLYVEGKSSFGNGVEVAVLNETGGREVILHDQLSAHEAYIEAIYRHRPALTARLREMAQTYAQQNASERGRIGEGVVICDAGTICNMKIGDAARIEGATRLCNGTLASTSETPVTIGADVIADDFIVQGGSHVKNAVHLTRVYVGQACVLDHGYSASDSVFFCNCQESNGEACALFAGPFTVTHHKSTLLIAGMFSFMNAGSGSNQSNHMYKLGPIHQGAMERGSKTASNSYILWPARVGAFSLVMGRHTTNPDTSALPFSYLIENKGVSYLAPGVNLRSVGTIRDVQKWPRRDRRPLEGRLDQVNFNLLSPYTMAKMVRGIEVLQQLRDISGATSETYSYQSALISRSALTKGLEYYTLALHKFLGNSLISRLEKAPTSDYLSFLKPEASTGEGAWIDLAGLIAPKSQVALLLDDIESGRLTASGELAERFADMHAHYYDWEWAWAYREMLRFYGLDERSITLADLRRIVEQWLHAVTTLDHMLYEDARKEFSLSSKTGFGFDGHEKTAKADFEQVRGIFETNPFVAAILEHIERKSALGHTWLERLQ